MLVSHTGAILVHTVLGLVLFTSNASPQQVQPAFVTFPCADPGQAGVFFETTSAEWSWSPDGSKIVYDRAIGDVSQLRVQEVETGIVRCLTDGSFHASQPDWAPDGQSIAVVRQSAMGSAIQLLDISTGTSTALTAADVRSEYPRFSHDGQLLAYVRHSSNDARRRFVIVRDLVTNTERTVFESSFGLNNLSWSPADRSVILYSIDKDGWNDIYAARADGSVVSRLTDNTVTDTYSAEYAFDGSRIIFGQGSEDSPFQRWFNYDLYERNTVSGDVRRLTWAYQADDRAHYSPSGSTIGFVSRRSGYAEIYLMDADGNHLRPLTAQPEQELARFIHKNGLEAAHEHFARTRETNPNARIVSALTTFVLTRQFLARGQTEDAVAVARMGVATHPHSWRALTALGEALLARGDRAAAFDALRMSLGEFPNQYQLVFLLGHDGFLALLNATDNAWVTKRQELLDLSHRLQTRGDFLTSLAILNRLAATHHHDPEITYRLGYTYMHLGDLSEAVRSFQNVLSVEPEHASALLHLRRLQQP